MIAMTGDVRDRILELLGAGPAEVAALSERLGLPGGVVSYELKRLEQAGLVRVGATRTVRGVPTPVYVSTAAAAAPALPVPEPLPGLTRTEGNRFPVPLWTVRPATAEAAPTRTPGAEPAAPGAAEPVVVAPRSGRHRSDTRPRLFDIRRIPVDDATFYEFAERLEALAEEFAGRADPDAAAAELTIVLHRPAAAGDEGHGS